MTSLFNSFHQFGVFYIFFFQHQSYIEQIGQWDEWMEIAIRRYYCEKNGQQKKERQIE